jgi:2-oxoglutarate ferredoxin oxidoreductase subunit alpha
MMEPVDVTVTTPQAGATHEKPWALTGTQGERAPNIINSLYMDPEILERTNVERFERYAAIAQNETRWEEYLLEDAEIVAVAYGAAARITRNAVQAARAQGIKAGLLRPITLWPFPKAILNSTAQRVKSFVCVELSMGQMHEDVELATRCQKPVLLCARTGGMVPSPEEILAKFVEAERGVN